MSKLELLLGAALSDQELVTLLTSELEERLRRPEGAALESPSQVYALLRDMGLLAKEQVRGLYLDSRRRLLFQEIISVGTLTHSLIHPREVFAPAVARSAAAVILAHNHPSGDPTPSPDDLAVTRRLRQAGDILGIELTDHLVIGRTRYVSLRERGAW